MIIKDCPLTAKGMRMVTTVWGRNIAMLKGKTVRTAPPVVRQDVIEFPKEIPKEIWELHKMVILAIDFFCQQDPILCHQQSSYLLPDGD